MATTAVSFRKGNTEENDNFAGVRGEIVADLGANEQTTENATIVLHTGDGLAGGIRMARADLNNITPESISNLANFRKDSGQGTYYGLLRRNLSNYMSNDVNAAVVGPTLKEDYSIASRDGQDLSTEALAGIAGSGGPIDRSAGGKYLLNRDLSNLHQNGENIVKSMSFNYWVSNVDTAALATNYNESGKEGTKLAYANMTNVNTNTLSGSRTPEEIAERGKNLATADLQNVGYKTIVDYLDAGWNTEVNDNRSKKYEWVSRKTNVIDPYNTGTGEYPTTQAVIDYGDSLALNYANRNLDNIQNWDIASKKEDLYKIKVAINTPGSGYSASTTLHITNSNLPGGFLDVVITKVSTPDGKILAAEPAVSQTYKSAYVATMTVNDNDQNKGAIFEISSEAVVAGKLMQADLSNSDISNSLGTHTAAIGYERTYDNNSATVSIDAVSGQLADSSTNSFASFSVDRELTELQAKLSSADTNTNKISSIAVTKTNAYLNKNTASEAQDADHQLLNRGEMDARYQLQPVSATQDNIAIFNVDSVTHYKSTIDSGKAFTTNVANAIGTASNNKVPTEYAVREAIEEAVTRAVVYKGTANTENDLPSSGNTNGDLWWIRAFSNNPPVIPGTNPPQTYTPGHSGTAIWNAELDQQSPNPHWDYKEDTINDPDNTTLQLNSSGKMSVKLSQTADNALITNSTGLYVSGNSFVSSTGYVAVAAVSGQSGKVLTNNGTNTSWRTATPEPPTTQGIYHLVVDANGAATWVEDRRLELGPVA